MNMLPKFVSLWVVYCLTIKDSHQYRLPVHVLEDLFIPKPVKQQFAEPSVLSNADTRHSDVQLNKHDPSLHAAPSQPDKPIDKTIKPDGATKPGSNNPPTDFTTQPPASNVTTTTWPEKLKRMEKYFGRQIDPKFYPYYNWYYDKLRDMRGKLKRMQFQFHYRYTFDYEDLILSRTTEFPIPNVVNFKNYISIKELDRLTALEEVKNPKLFEGFKDASFQGPFNSKEKFTEFKINEDDYVTMSTKWRDW